MELAVLEYGATIITPPESAFEDLDIIDIKGATPRAWSVRFDFWTKEEGLSDLSLELTLINGEEELLNVEIDNIHVV